MSRPDAFLMRRTDFIMQDLEIPPVPEREIEGLIRYRLRSLYPGNPDDTSFDYRLLQPDKNLRRTQRAFVFIARKTVIDASRQRAGHRPLALPFTLLKRIVPRTGSFRAWVFDATWAEHILFQDGVPVSSVVQRYTRGRKFDFAREDAALVADAAIGDAVLVAHGEYLSSLRLPEGVRALPLEKLLQRFRKGEGLFETNARVPKTSALLRLAGLSLAIALLCILVFVKYTNTVEARADELHALTLSLEKSGQNVLTLQREIEDLEAERDRLVERTPRDAYALLSELSRVLGDNARVRSISLQDDAFQVDALGTNPLSLMERFKEHPGFKNIKLAQVVPDARSGRERFSFSGAFDGR
jgi:hypothetical protein